MSFILYLGYVIGGFSIGFFVGFANAKAQTSEQRATNTNPKVKEAAMKARAGTTSQQHSVKITGKEGQNPDYAGLQGVTEDDPYQGRTQEFLNLMVVIKLPTDFPTYEKGTGIKYYNQVVDNYFRQHLDLLKEQPKQKLSVH